jgi:hypothetical protein
MDPDAKPQLPLVSMPLVRMQTCGRACAEHSARRQPRSAQCRGGHYTTIQFYQPLLSTNP